MSVASAPTAGVVFGLVVEGPGRLLADVEADMALLTVLSDRGVASRD
jgi:hypothetical protein